MQTIWTASKCPKCGREYRYQQIVSCVLPTDKAHASVMSGGYTRTCECGEILNFGDMIEIGNISGILPSETGKRKIEIDDNVTRYLANRK